MARVTVEDCILNVENRFELVLLAAKRAREIAAGAPLTVARDNDKNAVVSLREISESSIDILALREKLIKGMLRSTFYAQADQEINISEEPLLLDDDRDMDEDDDMSDSGADEDEDEEEGDIHEQLMVESDLASDSSLNITVDSEIE